MNKSKFYMMAFVALAALFLIVMMFPQANLQQTAPESAPRFEIDQSLLKILVKSEEITAVNMRIMNVDDKTIGIAVQPSSSMENIVSVSDAAFDVKPGQTKIVRLTISGKSSDTEYSPGVYTGKILVKSDTVIKEVPIIVEIESKYVLFDTNIYANLENRQVPQGADSLTEIKLFNLMGQETTSVNMEYYIKDMNDNTIITESESAVVTTQTTFTKIVKIPSNLKSGMYVFAVNSKYGSSVGTSSYLFYVYSPTYVAPDFVTMCVDNNVCLMGSFVLVALLIMTGAFAYMVAHLRPDHIRRVRAVREKGLFDSLLKRYDRWEKDRERLKELQIKEKIAEEREHEKKKSFFELLLRRRALRKKREERLEKLEEKAEAKIKEKSFLSVLSKRYASWKNKRKKIKMPKIKLPKIKLPKFNVSAKIAKIKTNMKRDEANRRRKYFLEKRKAENAREPRARERRKRQLATQRKIRKINKQITFGIPHSLGLAKTRAEKAAETETNKRRAIERAKQTETAQKRREERKRTLEKQKQQRKLAVMKSKREFSKHVKLIKTNTFSMLNKIGLAMTPAQRRAADAKKALERKRQDEDRNSASEKKKKEREALKNQEEKRVREERERRESQKQREEKQKELQRKKEEHQRKTAVKKAEQILKRQIRQTKVNAFKAMNQLGIIKTAAQKRKEAKQRALEKKKREEEMRGQAMERIRQRHQMAVEKKMEQERKKEETQQKLILEKREQDKRAKEEAEKTAQRQREEYQREFLIRQKERQRLTARKQAEQLKIIAAERKEARKKWQQMREERTRKLEEARRNEEQRRLEIKRREKERKRRARAKRAEERRKKQIRQMKVEAFKALNKLGIIKIFAQRRAEAKRRAAEERKEKIPFQREKEKTILETEEEKLLDEEKKETERLKKISRRSR